MAMLAEPKSRQKYGNDPRNTFWSNDESKFGFRMLESMGWKKGKGLGANESGIIEHVKTVKRSNTDTRGVGCSKSHADNWIAHQDGFDELLSSLNNGPSSSATGGKETSAVSLEEKSRSSRSRVHYHKFTRGKDLSSRSSSDLDCIFGKRKGQSSETSTLTTRSEANSDDEEYEAKPSSKLDTSTASDSSNNNDTIHGVKTITSSTSVHEYFAMKMAELKRKRAALPGSDNASADSGEGCNTPDNTNSKREESKNEPAALVHGESAHTNDSKKRKKLKKASTKQEEESPQEQSECSMDVSEADGEASNGAWQVVRSKKSKKKNKKEKHKTDKFECEAEVSEMRDENSYEEERSVSDTDKEDKKRRKKSKTRKSAETGLSETEKESNNNTSILRHESDSRTRRRKSVRFSLGGDEVFTIPGKEESTLEDTIQQELPNLSMEEKVSKKKKKKKAQATEEEVSKKKKREAATEEEVSKTKKRKEATEEEVSKTKKEATEEVVSEKREEATEEEVSQKKRREAKEEKLSKKKREKATEEKVSETEMKEEATEERVSKKKRKREEATGEKVSKKRKREETESEEEGPPKSKKPEVIKPAATDSTHVEAESEIREDSAMPAPQNTPSTPSNAVACSNSSLLKRKSPKKNRQLSKDHVDRICQRFEGANIDCVSGYGNITKK